jgi:hypothetical protein
MARRRKYTRPIGRRRYRRLFVLSTEGTNTEPQYFSMFNDDNTVVLVKIIKNRGSAPNSVLRQMTGYLKESNLQANDAAWLIVDKDRWTDEQLRPLHEWAQSEDRYGLAVSNPMFEFWLLLHFENGDGITSARNCITRLKRHLPGYDKNLHTEQLMPHVEEALSRAEGKDSPPCEDWPRNIGTTVYRLVKDLENSG